MLFSQKKSVLLLKKWCKFYSAKSSPHGHCQREKAALASLTGVDRFMTRNRRPRSKSNYQTGPPSFLSSSSGPAQQWFSTVPYWQWAPWGTEGMPCLAGWPGHYRTTPGCTAPAAMSQWVTINALALGPCWVVIRKIFEKSSFYI